jgi:hypothetical protein
MKIMAVNDREDKALNNNGDIPESRDMAAQPVNFIQGIINEDY